jgi:hypothetical protein
VLEAESQGAAESAVAAVPSPAIPASLHASLMARLDRLGTAEEVAQIGAAIGREFSHALLAAPEAELGSALDRLMAAGLLFRKGVPPHATYVFKHALVQDTAYGSYCVGPDAHFTPVSSTPLKANSLISPRAGRSCWRVTTPRLARSRRLRACGAKRDSDRRSARRWLKPQSRLCVLWPRSRPCPPLPRCVASRSGFRSRL